jgi:hypothetical protein
LVIGLIGSIVSKKLRTLGLLTTLAALLALVLLDITRLQPWIFHYGVVVAIIALARLLQSKQQAAIDACAIVIGGIYFWSGIQKFNAAFFLDVFPWFTQHLWSPFGEIGQTVFGTFGIAVPFLEAGLAIGLFTRRFRTVSIFGTFAMLLVVLSSIGPFGHAWNASVWPWNIVIFLSVVAIFYANQDTFRTFILRQKRQKLSWVIFIIFWLMAIGNLFGLTDHYLSWSLYSGRVPTATLIANQTFLNTLSPLTNEVELPIEYWTLSTLNVAPYPEARVFKTVFTTLCETYPTENILLKIKTPRLFVSTDYSTETFSCQN